MKSYKSEIFLVLIGCILACSQLLHAYTHSHCGNTNLKWPNEKIRWHAGKKSFPSGSAWRTALLHANARWNEAPGEFTFVMSPIWGDASVGRSNDQNEIWFSRTQSLLDGAPARCFTRWSCWSNRIIEADIVFDADVAWTTSKAQAHVTAYGGSRRPWGTTAIHEMGHALGLRHEDDTYNVMGQDWDHIHTNNGVVRWYAGEDAGHGEVHLYGKTNTTRKNDVGVSHWKHTGSTTKDIGLVWLIGYSKHGPCQIYTLEDQPVGVESFAGWRRYIVASGEIYKVQFTYENNGYYDQMGVDVAYYISTNNLITTNDRLIGLATLNFKRNKPYTLAIHLRMPHDLIVGQTYYIGVVVDYTRKINEFNSANNATWIPIRVVKKVIIPEW